MLSPYFSPGPRERPQDSVVYLGVKTQAAENFDGNDPLFRYYFRRFLDLYQQLSFLKPILIQEVVANNPWQLIVAVTLLNKTTAKAAIPVFWKLLKRWPTPWAMSRADKDDLREEIYHLGTHNVRAKRLIEMSLVYSRDPPCRSDARLSNPLFIKDTPENPVRRGQRYPPTPISHLPGTGPYALDSYRIFCTAYDDPFCEEWKKVLPADKELVLYLERWKWAFEERKEWSPLTGRAIPADIPFLESLVRELAEHHAHQQRVKKKVWVEQCT